MDKKLKIQIIFGSTRQNRQGEKVAKWVVSEAKHREDWAVEFLDLRDWPLPFFDEVGSPSDLRGNYSSEIAKKWAAKVGEADGYIIITPEYNHGYPAVLKNALDYAYAEWVRKPVAFVSYGGSSGGARSVEQLREVVSELEMAGVRSAIHMVYFRREFDDTGKLKDEITWNKRLGTVFDDLVWWTKALKSARSSS